MTFTDFKSIMQVQETYQTFRTKPKSLGLGCSAVIN